MDRISRFKWSPFHLKLLYWDDDLHALPKRMLYRAVLLCCWELSNASAPLTSGCTY